MPSNVGNSKNGAFKFLKDRAWNKVKVWMAKVLSAEGKEVLIKSVAQAVPVFSMSCFKLPRGLCEHINSLSGSSGGAVKMARENQARSPWQY